MTVRTAAAVMMLVVSLAGTGCARDAVFSWQPRTYTVQPGDTLYSIAFNHRLDWRALAAWNGIEPPGYLIRPGETLRLAPPPADARRDPPPPASAPAPEPPERRATDWHWPTDGEVVARFDDGSGSGKGIGIAGRPGQPIHAAAAGRVVYTGSGLVGYGKLIIIKHDNSRLSAYAHNREILVREDEAVHAGQRIATMGEAPGRRAMLHFEVRVDGRAVDPMQYLPPLRGR